MTKKLSVKELADLLFGSRKMYFAAKLYDSYDEESGEKGYTWMILLSHVAKSPTVLCNYDGGGALFGYEIGDDEDASGLEGSLASYLEQFFDISEGVWIDTGYGLWLTSNIEAELNCVRFPAEKEKGGMAVPWFDRPPQYSASPYEWPCWWARSPVVQKRPKLTVEVKGGRVASVFSTSSDVDVEILDMDTDDSEKLEELEKKHQRNLERFEKKELYLLE